MAKEVSRIVELVQSSLYMVIDPDARADGNVLFFRFSEWVVVPGATCRCYRCVAARHCRCCVASTAIVIASPPPLSSPPPSSSGRCRRHRVAIAAAEVVAWKLSFLKIACLVVVVVVVAVVVACGLR